MRLINLKTAAGFLSILMAGSIGLSGCADKEALNKKTYELESQNASLRSRVAELESKQAPGTDPNAGATASDKPASAAFSDLDDIAAKAQNPDR